MSLYFDLVINCDLKEDITEGAIEAIQSLVQHDYTLTVKPNLTIPGYGNMWDVIKRHHCLAPDPAHEVISNFRRCYRMTTNNRAIYRYRLQYCGSSLHNDYFYQNHLPFIYWLATVAYDSYIGYYMETQGGAGGREVNHLRIENGKLISR